MFGILEKEPLSTFDTPHLLWLQESYEIDINILENWLQKPFLQDDKKQRYNRELREARRWIKDIQEVINSRA